ncbi:hypothetical protein KP509_20G092000 [Ceratopteris richardii]|uniref:Peroxisomal membrane protein PMP22 n=1 Tax=Ceratopteris richardii TaxID=49495 RepID=A0A8T2SKX4_CERRI|nr:hypothetical protein KP509_20G092000 [Ceratopteris richardii]
MGGLVNDAGRKYLLALRDHPLRTKAITAGCIAGCSQTIAQKIGGAKRLDYRRIALVFLYGFAYAGPFGHFFHKLMDRIFKRKQDGATIAKKVVLEQVFSGPWNNLIYMLYFGLILEGRPWSFVKNKVKRDFVNVQLNSWKVWPIVSLLNYRYVPLELRVLFHGLAAACWGVFLNLKVRTLAVKAA